MESLKEVEENQNKRDINDSGGFTELQNSLISIPSLEM